MTPRGVIDLVTSKVTLVTTISPHYYCQNKMLRGRLSGVRTGMLRCPRLTVHLDTNLRL
jgi:hypothetical protein